MRVALLVVLLAGCGHRDPEPHPREEVASAAPTAPAFDDIGQRIADELVKLPDNKLVYLHELGWIEVKTYKGYTGRNPRSGSAVNVPEKRLPFWTSTPQLAALVAHEPEPPLPAAYRDEYGRYMAAIHDGDQNPPGEDPSIDVTRLFWADDLDGQVQRDLLAKHEAEIPHVAHLHVKQEDGRTFVTFEVTPELEARLNPPQ